MNRLAIFACAALVPCLSSAAEPDRIDTQAAVKQLLLSAPKVETIVWTDGCEYTRTEEGKLRFRRCTISPGRKRGGAS